MFFFFVGHILKGCVYIVLFSVDYQRESIFLKKYRNRRNLIVEKPPFVVTRTFLQRPTRTGEIQQESQGPETKSTHFLSLFLFSWIKTKPTSAS